MAYIFDDDDFDSDPLDDYVGRNTLDDVYGCEFPEECIMAGPHALSECHTAEMLERYEEGAIEVQ
jgi:hypothetical protein